MKDFKCNELFIVFHHSFHIPHACFLQAIAAERVSHMIILDEGNNSSVNADQIHELLNSLSPNDVIILSVPPLTAQDIWKIAVQVVQ